MPHPRPARTLLAVLVTALATGAALAVPAHAGGPSIDLQPQKLARGSDIAIPHIEDGDFVDGTRRIELPGTVARVIGQSGEAWLVGTNNVDRKRNRRVVRVEADGAVVDVLRDLDPSTVMLTDDGTRLVAIPRYGRREAAVRVWSAVDGTAIAQRTFAGYPELLDADGRKVLLRNSRQTFWWRVAENQVRPVTRKLGGIATIEHDLLSTYTKDPYLGGCTKLVRLSDLRTTVWTSCTDRIAAFSPDGTQMLTFHILTDGVGPGEIRLREVDGTRLASWSTNWFSGWEWESPSTVLLDVNGKRTFATVRCTLDDCENATDPVPVQAP